MAETNNDIIIESFSQLKPKLFRNRLSEDKLHNAKLIDALRLYQTYQPKYLNTNKKALLDDIKEKYNYTPTNKNILITRFCPKPLPKEYKSEQHNDKTKEYSFTPTVFDYQSSNESHVTEWHMNFANNDIFGFYHGDLLAQDELQVLECPQLASIREYLLQQDDINKHGKSFATHVIETDSKPYPILIGNIERVISLNTENLYGNRFSTSSLTTVLEAYNYLEPPQIVNIIAIEAPKYGQGSYTIEQIDYILQACYTGYSAAKKISKYTYELNNDQAASEPVKTNIHTGWFGCGAYGGNRIIMIILQILAAKMAGIDKLIIHTVKDDSQHEIDAANSFLNNIFNEDQNQLTIDELMEKIIKQDFQWGITDGT